MIPLNLSLQNIGTIADRSLTEKKRIETNYAGMFNGALKPQHRLCFLKGIKTQAFKHTHLDNIIFMNSCM